MQPPYNFRLLSLPFSPNVCLLLLLSHSISRASRRPSVPLCGGLYVHDRNSEGITRDGLRGLLLNEVGELEKELILEGIDQVVEGAELDNDGCSLGDDVVLYVHCDLEVAVLFKLVEKGARADGVPKLFAGPC